MRIGRLATLCAAVACLTSRLEAQRVRLRSTTTAQFVQLRPLTQDSSGAFSADTTRAAIPISEDVEVSAWGLGITGLRGYGLFRLRGAAGSELVWPRYSDHFDALAAYLELERPTYRVRLGRQQRASGLGLYGFDGAGATWRPAPNARLEAYGGRAMARGFNDPINNSAIVGLDPLLPDHGTLLIGVSGWMAPTSRSTVSAVYQREVLNDFSGVVSERFAADAQAMLARRWTFTASGDYDLAASALGKVRLGAVARLPGGGSAGASLFRYRPTFDLTTIWGAFAPQAHHGATFAATLPSFGAVSLSAGWTIRTYEEATATTPFLVNVGTTSNALSVGAQWARAAWTVSGTYRYSTGFGGQESGGDVHAAWARSEKTQFGLTATAFQNTEYFRVARGTVVGIGADARTAVTDRISVAGHLVRYAHVGTSGMDAPNWSQVRALLQVDWIFGASADRAGSYR